MATLEQIMPWFGMVISLFCWVLLNWVCFSEMALKGGGGVVAVVVADESKIGVFLGCGNGQAQISPNLTFDDSWGRKLQQLQKGPNL